MTTRPVLTVVIEIVNNIKYGSIKENGQTIIFQRNMKCVVGEHWLCLFQVDHSFFKISFAVAS